MRPHLPVAFACLRQLPSVHGSPGLGALPASCQLELRAVVTSIAPCAPVQQEQQ